MSKQSSQPIHLRERISRYVKRWGAYWIVGAALLAATEMLWLWQTWPVRDLLNTISGGASQ